MERRRAIAEVAGNDTESRPPSKSGKTAAHSAHVFSEIDANEFASQQVSNFHERSRCEPRTPVPGRSNISTSVPSAFAVNIISGSRSIAAPKPCQSLTRYSLITHNGPYPLCLGS